MSVGREAAPEEARNARDRAYAAAMRDIMDGRLTYPRAVHRLRLQYGRAWRELEAPVYEWKREHDKRHYRYVPESA
jgi:hypothetical protein